MRNAGRDCESSSPVGRERHLDRAHHTRSHGLAAARQVAGITAE
jgi:hypothetical protein